MPETAYLVTRGIVLRETETKEADKILTVLTREEGKISVIARGARRKGCRFTAAAQTLAYSEWTLYRRGDWYYVNEGSTLELFCGLRNDLELLALGFYFAELAEAVTSEGEPAAELLPHLLNGLYALGTLHKPPRLVKAVFEWKLLCLAGYEPLVDGCAYCGCEEPEQPLLDVAQGILRCRTCGAGESRLAMAERRLAFYRREHARMAGYDAEIFGVHYRNLYWADGPISDEKLMEQHRQVYRSSFPAPKYEHNIHIPRRPDAPPPSDCSETRPEKED